jgi:hypothetical protein
LLDFELGYSFSNTGDLFPSDDEGSLLVKVAFEFPFSRCVVKEVMSVRPLAALSDV